LLEEISPEQVQFKALSPLAAKDNEAFFAVETQPPKKKKNKKRVHHFHRDGVDVVEEAVVEIDSEKLKTEEPVPKTFNVTTDQLILQSFEHASTATITMNDVCWICNEKWNEFVDLRLVTVFPCSHSACSSCVLKLLKTSNEKQKDGMGEFTYKFNCGICRHELDETIPYEAANQVLNKSLVPSFVQFISSGRTKEERRERRQLIYSLLVDRFEYDVQRVEATLFNLIDIMEVDGSDKLTTGNYFFLFL
jgi:hypothetical protein